MQLCAPAWIPLKRAYTVYCFSFVRAERMEVCRRKRPLTCKMPGTTSHVWWHNSNPWLGLIKGCLFFRVLKDAHSFELSLKRCPTVSCFRIGRGEVYRRYSQWLDIKVLCQVHNSHMWRMIIDPWQELIGMCSLYTAPEEAEFDPGWDVDSEYLRWMILVIL